MKSRLKKPSRLIQVLLWSALSSEDYDELMGDFEESYRYRIEMGNRIKAYSWLWWQLIRSLPTLVSTSIQWRMLMFRNYLKIALRNIRKHKGYALINIIGLAIGMVCCILILLWVQDELSYDRYHENADRIYRVTRLWYDADGIVNLHLGHVAPPIGPLLENDFNEIEHAVRIIGVGGGIVSRGNQIFQENRLFFAEEALFKIFTFDMIRGDSETALREPLSMVISDEIAEKYFGSENPMEQTLTYEIAGIKADYRITGVFRRIPHNSHYHADILASFSTYAMAVGSDELQDWSSNNYATYLLLPEGYDIEVLKAQMEPFIERHYAKGREVRTRLVIQKLTDIHLHSHLDSEIEANGDVKNVYIFSAIAFFVLLIACINFMNLSTARSVSRAKEVGMRKVVGARRPQVIRQFLNESIFMAFVALTLAIIIVVVLLPHFNRFIYKELQFSPIRNPSIVFGLGGIALFVGLVAGSYPAFFLSSFRPVRVLRGYRGTASGGVSLRAVLVVLQFAISIVLIAGVIIVNKQLGYMRNTRLGFDKEHVVVLPSFPSLSDRIETVRHRLLEHPNIISVSAAKRVPSGRLLDSSWARVIGGEKDGPVDFRIAFLRVDHDYIPTFGIQMAAGRNFSRLMRTDSTEAFILNESAVSRIGWASADEAIGQEFAYGSRQGLIIGIMKDFHFESMHQEIAPIVLLLSKYDLNQVAIRIRPDHIPETIAFLEDLWREYRPRFPFTYYFIDERFDQLYRTEEKLQELFGGFAFLAILIACLGLFGLVSFTTEQRTKEIGIRKVLGASVPKVIVLLAATFTKWVILANLFALPLAWFVMITWLKNFAYRTNLGPAPFILSAIISLIIALITVGFQTIRAALTNPVDSLRYE